MSDIEEIKDFFENLRASNIANLEEYFTSLNEKSSQQALKLFHDYIPSKQVLLNREYSKLRPSQKDNFLQDNPSFDPNKKEDISHNSLQALKGKITLNNNQYSFAFEEETLGMLALNSELPMKDQEERLLTFFNEEGEEKSYIVKRNGKELEFLDKTGKYVPIKETEKNSRTFTYQQSAEKAFFNDLTEAYQKYSEKFLTLEQAIAETRVDYVLEHFDMSKHPLEIFKLNYFEKGEHGLKDRYGTFLHKAIKKLTADKFNRNIDTIEKNLDMSIVREYLELTDEDSKTALDIAKADNKLKEQKNLLERILRNDQPRSVKAQGQDIDTHQQSVHKTVDKSIVKLLNNLNKDKNLNIIKKQDEYHADIDRTAAFNQIMDDSLVECIKR
jgi:hypothetical protein